MSGYTNCPCCAEVIVADEPDTMCDACVKAECSESCDDCQIPQCPECQEFAYLDTNGRWSFDCACGERTLMNRVSLVHTAHGTFTVPLGLSSDLVRKLIEDERFAHMWLVHDGDETKHPDGCDELGDPARVRLFLAIERVPS